MLLRRKRSEPAVPRRRRRRIRKLRLLALVGVLGVLAVTAFAYGSVVAVFENEPRNINLLHDHFPDALAFYIDTKHSSGAPPVEAGITHFPDFSSFRPQ